MKRNHLVMTCWLTYLLFFSTAFGQIDEQAARILESAQAFHGSDALRNVTTVSSINRYTQYDAAGNPVATVHIALYMDLARKIVRTEVRTPETELLRIEQLGPDTFLWTPEGGTEPLPEAAVTTLRNSLYQGWVGLTYDASERERLISVEAESASTRGVIVTTEGVTTVYLIDESGNLAAERVEDPRAGTFFTIYHDPARVDDLVVPTRASVYQNDTLVGTMDLLGFKVNTPLEGFFEQVP